MDNKKTKKDDTEYIVRDNGDRCCTWLFDLFKRDDKKKEGDDE